jgi:four helix bundle protein
LIRGKNRAGFKGLRGRGFEGKAETKGPSVQGLKGTEKEGEKQGSREKMKAKDDGQESESKALRSYKDLKVWQKAYALCLNAYRVSHAFPADERYGLTSQLRRAAVSIPSSIAEGYGRKTKPDYIRCLHIAYGSLCELETQTLLSRDLGYTNGG